MSVFIQEHVPFLTPEQLYNLGEGRLLGAGSYGSVRQLVYEGTEAIKKELLDEVSCLELLREAHFLVQMNGAGGVPRLLAVCQTPPVLVQEFVGQTYEKYLYACSVGGFLNSLISLSQRLGEIHAKGIVHNDLKVNNITFTGTVSEPVFHIIDFGLACRVGQVAPGQELAFSETVVRNMRPEKYTQRTFYEIKNEDFLCSFDED